MTRDEHPLPADLATPRRPRLWPGVVIGGALLLLDVGLLAYALTLP
jgi:hypothetical protein